MGTPITAAEVATQVPLVEGSMADGNRSLPREMQFADHSEAMGFVVRVRMAAEVLDHHPDLRIVNNRVDQRCPLMTLAGSTKEI
ncbi:MAG: 4a-hydroxytetrahydrobiopterin dehydratase [Anaerolineaceae bacterium]